MFNTGLIICWTLKNNYLNIFAFSYRLSEKKNYFQSYFETISKKKIARFIPHKYTANCWKSNEGKSFWNHIDYKTRTLQTMRNF